MSFNIAPNLTSGQNYILGVRVNKLSGSDEDNTCSCDSLMEYVKWDYLKNYGNQAVLNYNQTTFGDNLLAWQMELLNKDNGYKTFLTWTINNGLGYSFLYSAPNDMKFDTLLNDFNNLLQSVNFISTNATTPITEQGKTPSFMSTPEMKKESESESLMNLNESPTDTGVNTADTIAIKMEFGDKRESLLDMLIYSLEDQNFIVGNHSPICPNQNCNFEFKDTELVYQPGSNDITLEGTIKIDTGDVTKINKFFSRLQPTEAREDHGMKTETVQGTFGVGKEPLNGAEFEYNVNGTLETHKGDKTLSLQGVQCNGVNNDNSKPIDCNY